MTALPNDHDRFLRRYGPWAVVTGASDGIGRALALELASRGFSLVLVARRLDPLRDLAALLVERGVATRIVAVDLSRPDGCQTLLPQTEGLDVGLLVAAAGFGTSGAFLKLDPATEAEMLAVNCGATLSLTHAFARRFTDRGRGGIVLMSSLLAFQGVPRSATYAATKAFVQTLVEGLSTDLKGSGVDILAAAPGPVRSGFADRANMRMGFALTPDRVAIPILKALGKRTTVRPGWLSWALEAAFFGQPRWMRSWILTRIMRSMTEHQEDRL